MNNAPALRRDTEGRAYIRVSAKVARLISGQDDLSAWDGEELLRGQARSKRGKFEGRPPSLVPRAVYQEFARRQIESGFADMVGDLGEIVRTVRSIATDPTVDESVRLRAADMVLDRVLGKPRQAMDFSVEERPKYMELLDQVTSVSVDRTLPDYEDDTEPAGGADDGIIDAELVEESAADTEDGRRLTEAELLERELGEWDD